MPGFIGPAKPGSRRSRLWNTALVGWIWTLARLRSSQNPRRALGRAWPQPPWRSIGLAWLKPLAWDLGLVYLHPLVALCFLDRELAIHRLAWQRTYRRLLVALPLALAGLWWHLADAPPLPGGDALTARITAHAGAEILSGVSNHLLVATHTFLEMLHYGVWLVAIPLVSLRTLPWRIAGVPLARRSRAWRVAIALSAGHWRAAGRRILGRLSGRLSAHPRHLLHGRHAPRARRISLPATAALRRSPPHDTRRAVAIPADRIRRHRARRAADLARRPGRRPLWRTRLTAAIWLTACTYPIVVLVLPLSLGESLPRLGSICCIAETFAPLAECLLFWFTWPDEIADRRSWWRDMAAIVLANLASFSLGELLW